MDGGQFPAAYSVLSCEAYQAGERTNRTNLDFMAALKAVRRPPITELHMLQAL